MCVALRLKSSILKNLSSIYYTPMIKKYPYLDDGLDDVLLDTLELMLEDVVVVGVDTLELDEVELLKLDDVEVELLKLEYVE